MRKRKSVLGSDPTQRNVETIASLEKAIHEQRTAGEILADRFAAIVGSWPFILGQAAFLLAWVIVNLVEYVGHWDPYPFILLNLVLSFQAAFASPIIMMSQNRQGRLATRRNQLDLQINLLAEQESTETLRLLRRLCEHLAVDIPQPPRDELEAVTSPEEVLEQIESVEREVA
jgi:uncharacterized membrane protein